MPEYCAVQYKDKDANKIDQDIYNYIIQNEPENYTEILINDSRWEVFQHLSPMRKSLFNWYDFGDDIELLEVGGGFGSLTSLFCEKCKYVVALEKNITRAKAIRIRCQKYNNLKVCAMDIKDYCTDKKYDVIVMAGVLERIANGKKERESYIDFLKYIVHFLKPTGKVLVAVDNKYGLQSFCGAPEKYTGIPFAGINGYQEETLGYTFDRMEIKDIIRDAGLSYTKFYYPLPDYKNPQLVYSEKYLKGSSLKERMIPYYINTDTLLANQMDLYVDIMKNHALEFLANSFLIEATINGNFCDVIFACMSTDRGKEGGFVTTIYENNIVKKYAIFDEGKHNLRKIYENILEIKERGVPIIDHTMTNDILQMPYIHAVTLSEYLMELFLKDVSGVIPVFEKLYVYICMSSEHAMPEENILLKKENKNWGIILRKAYIDMVPANAFYIDGEIYFYDQEFVVENIPAKYVMYRAIKYTYVYVKKAEGALPIAQMKDYFGLTELWEHFEEYERGFIKKNRKTDEYSQFYKWTKVNKKRMHQNAENLLIHEKMMQSENVEKKDDLVVKIQKKLLLLLRSFIDICETNNLHYFLFYGSLLGAVRHGGFIPWDDDLDIVMPRTDYDKFQNIVDGEKDKFYEFQSPQSESNCFYGGYGKFRDKNTSAIDRNNWGHECNLGICIDIFPIDGIVANNEIRKKEFAKNKKIQKLLFAKTYANDFECMWDITREEWSMLCSQSQMYTFDSLYSEFVRNIKAYKPGNGDYVGILTRYYVDEKQQRFFPKEFFEKHIWMDFEGIKVRVPEEYNQCLITLYGRRYMEIPPVDKRKKHDIFYDVYKPYKYYLDKAWKGNVKGKKIVLYGSGEIAELFIKKYGTPGSMVDPDRGLWGRLKYEIIIKPPEILEELAIDDYYIVICMEDVGKAERRLLKMNISNYFIYNPFRK